MDSRSTQVAGAEAVIDVHGLQRIYRDRKRERIALDGVSLRVERGERLALLGPNGSGKSTFLRILATLDRPDAGQARILGDDGSRGWRAARSRLGVTFQQPGLDKLLTVRENLLAQAALYGLRGIHARDLVQRTAGALGIGDRAGSRVDTLSGGLARRADLARSLIHSPDLLLLDEPTTGLDPAARADFLDHLDDVAAARLKDGRAITIVMTTHLMDEAERCDRVAFMDAGKIVALDTPAGLRERLGEAVLRVAIAPGSPARAEVLQTLGAERLDVEESDRAVVARGDRARLARAAAALVERGRLQGLGAIEVSPPTLDDAFVAITGRSLAEAGDRLAEPGLETADV